MKLLIKWLWIIAFCHVLSIANAQNDTLHHPELEVLLKYPKSLQITIPGRNGQFVNLSHPWENQRQVLLKSDTAIYLFIDGSGIIYQYKHQHFVRLDSTIYRGYNYGAFPFIYKNELYNLGGSGYWRITGHLRKFSNKAHEWYIIPLNEENPILNEPNASMIWYDSKAGKIYCANFIDKNEGIKKQTTQNYNQYKVKVLDLNTMNWTNLGTLNRNLWAFTKTTQEVVMTPWGALLDNDGKKLLWDFEKNTLYRLPLENDKSQFITTNYLNGNLFCIDSTLYLCERDKIDTIPLSLAEFENTGIPIYVKETNQPKNNNTLVVIIAALVVVSGGLIFWKYYKPKKHQTSIQQIVNNNLGGESSLPTKSFPEYTDQEWEVIKLILQRTQNNAPTTIDELNSILGLKNKSLETQKSQRHKILTSINQKYLAIKGRELIIREPDAIDKRIKVYHIHPNAIDELKTNMSTINEGNI
ncbi:hypothetical protein [Hydrotalea sandarakina]|jgi:hypothetical protein|uniref:Uncharacterized protein n=1 Tax=Hydrotalea sandarakina TaxID=1004304 RepID=A0A2W7SDD5_9BACT|nr:hypothetical protein [Hydrotalea sandarakina]PZX60875.1 hypothetical protein LX80_02359 [Hydrotalea sandarakina]